jgi:glycosyltransferase involved in cell wall biosynthesis
MANVLVVGNGPLPELGMPQTGVAQLRSWQILRSLHDSPNTIHFYSVPRHDAILDPAPDAPKTGAAECDGFKYKVLPSSDRTLLLATLKEALDELKPSCIVATGPHPACVAAHLRSRLPLWVDLGGFPMAEAQVTARRTGDESLLEQAWEREQAILLRADKFSAASMPQLYAILGELATAGRLNRLTAHYHFAHHTPDAVHPLFAKPPAAGYAPLRRTEIPGDAFAVLWSGAFVSGADIEVLVNGMEKAMAANPKIHFVTTGAEVKGFDELTYRRFRSMVEKSPHAERYHLLGWVGLERLPMLYRECDLGINVDGRHYETLFGARRRLVNMMAAGLPVATTLGTEISHIIAEEDIGFLFNAGDPGALADTLLRASRQPHALRTLGQKGRNHVTRHLTAEALGQALREWVEEPRLAPDNIEKDRLMLPGAAFQEFPLNSVQETQLRLAGVELPDLFQAKIDIDIIRGKWWYRIGHEVKQATLRFLRKRHWIK